jgi:hypothetical protein
MRKVNPPTLISIAAKLVTMQISDNPDDYPKTMPKWVLRMIEAHNNKQRDWAMELRQIHDKQKENV